jgi:hypothetical protein
MRHVNYLSHTFFLRLSKFSMKLEYSLSFWNIDSCAFAFSLLVLAFISFSMSDAAFFIASIAFFMSMIFLSMFFFSLESSLYLFCRRCLSSSMDSPDYIKVHLLIIFLNTSLVCNSNSSFFLNNWLIISFVL